MLTRRSSPLMLGSLIMIPCLCSCATVFTKYNVTLPADFDLTKGDVKDKVPLTAGLYLRPQFRTCTLIERSLLAPQPTTHYIGDAFSNNCEKMLRNVFQGVVLIDGTYAAPSSKDMDVIVAPTSLRTTFQTKVPEGQTKAVLVHQMTIKWDITNPDGRVVYTTTVLGEVPVPIGMAGASFTQVGIEKIRGTEMADLLRVQFHKAQDDIYTNTWWKNQWWKSGK